MHLIHSSDETGPMLGYCFPAFCLSFVLTSLFLSADFPRPCRRWQGLTKKMKTPVTTGGFVLGVASSMVSVLPADDGK